MGRQYTVELRTRRVNGAALATVAVERYTVGRESLDQLRDRLELEHAGAIERGDVEVCVS